MEFDGDIDALALGQAEVALGGTRCVIAVKTLAAPEGDLLMPEKFVGDRIGDADFGAGGGAIARSANGADAEPVLPREIVAKNGDAFFFAICAGGAGDQVERTIVVDVAEAQALIDGGKGERGDAPFRVDDIECSIAGSFEDVEEVSAVDQDVSAAVVI